MVLTTLAGTVLGLAMTSGLAYLPTYLQMVHQLTPTEAGLMMLPMVVGMLVTGMAVGFIISKTGRYKMYPLVGMLVTTLGLYLFSTLEVTTSLTMLGVYMFIFGFGLGLVMQVLVLIVQNSFPLANVGTATSTNNFFRQIGSSIGASLSGSLFIHNMRDNLQERLPEALAQLGPEGAEYAQRFGEGGANSLTPELVAQLPEPVKEAVLASYNDGLTPVFQLMVPLAIVAFLLLLPVREEKLKEDLS